MNQFPAAIAGLAQNRRTTLSVGNTPGTHISRESAQSLAGVIVQCDSLHSIAIDHTHMDPAAFYILMRALMRNRSVQVIAINNISTVQMFRVVGEFLTALDVRTVPVKQVTLRIAPPTPLVEATLRDCIGRLRCISVEVLKRRGIPCRWEPVCIHSAAGAQQQHRPHPPPPVGPRHERHPSPVTPRHVAAANAVRHHPQSARAPVVSQHAPHKSAQQNAAGAAGNSSADHDSDRSYSPPRFCSPMSRDAAPPKVVPLTSRDTNAQFAAPASQCGQSNIRAHVRPWLAPLPGPQPRPHAGVPVGPAWELGGAVDKENGLGAAAIVHGQLCPIMPQRAAAARGDTNIDPKQRGALPDIRVVRAAAMQVEQHVRDFEAELGRIRDACYVFMRQADSAASAVSLMKANLARLRVADGV